jgi:hypothetical protein
MRLNKYILDDGTVRQLVKAWYGKVGLVTYFHTCYIEIGPKGIIDDVDFSEKVDVSPERPYDMSNEKEVKTCPDNVLVVA